MATSDIRAASARQRPTRGGRIGISSSGSRARAWGVVTTLGIFGFDPNGKRMRLEALHPEVTKDAVAAETGFEILMPERVETTEPPSEEELRLLRAIDPERRFLGPLA